MSDNTHVGHCSVCGLPVACPGRPQRQPEITKDYVLKFIAGRRLYGINFIPTRIGYVDIEIDVEGEKTQWSLVEPLAGEIQTILLEALYR